MYSTPKAVELLAQVEKEVASNPSSTSSSKSASGSSTARPATNGSATQRPNATRNSSTDSRDHKQGRQTRDFTPEQAAAVKKVMACKETAFYEMLSIEKTCSQDEVKKAYRKVCSDRAAALSSPLACTEDASR